MTLLDALRHQWRRRIRSPTWGQSLIGGLILVLAAAYFGVLFVGVGWFFPQIVEEVAPQQNPLRLLNEGLLYTFVGLVAFRFVLQRSAGSDVRPYLPLPLSRSQLVRIMQVLSALSLFNLVPVVTLAALWGSTVLPEVSAVGAGIGVLLATAVTQFLNSLLRVAWGRNAGLVLGVGGVLAVVVAGSNWAGTGALRTVSAWLFGGLGGGGALPLLVLGGVTMGTAVAAHRALRTRLYDVLGEASAGSGAGQTGPVFLGRRWGEREVVSIAMLDATLILRNKRPRQMMLLGLFVVVMFSMSTVTGDTTAAFNEVLFGFFLSGYLGLTYGQFGYAWHGGHFDRLLLHPASPTTLVRAQFLTLAGLCTAPSLLVVPVAAVLDPSLLVTLCVLLGYNLGVTAPALIMMGTWRREALELDQTAFFNYQGTTAGSFLYGALVALGVMGLPLVLAVGMGLRPTLLVLAGLGVLGLGTAPLWTRGVGRMLHGQRHAMATGFRDE
ncbi:MAG: DUF5687 family protein [Salinibacter sp.]